MRIRNKLLIVFCITLVLPSIFSHIMEIETQKNSIISQIESSNSKYYSYNDDNVPKKKIGYFLSESNNAIESVKVTCFLHLKTAQIQLDIDFVGSSSLSNFKLENSLLESILIQGDIRNVQIVESGSTQLEGSLLEHENGTIIQFQLSSEIPIGIIRNVKITFFQDTYDYETHYSYQLGIDWNRTIGSQNVIFICDVEISLLNTYPNPHTISTIGGQLTLSWLEVNPQLFQATLNYTRKIVLKELIITPSEWTIGNIRQRNRILEKTFTIFNNESTQLEGIIVTPSWITSNVTNWKLSVREKMYLKISIDLSQIGRLDGNISLQCTYTFLPVNIHISGEVIETNVTAIILGILGGVLAISLTITLVLLNRREKLVIKIEDEIIEKPELKYNINLDRWKELLTEKEYQIFRTIVEHEELTQSDLCRLTSLSKSTVSRAISRLEAKGLLKRKKYGISYFITINEEFFSST